MKTRVRLDFTYEHKGDIPLDRCDKFLTFIEAGLRATVLKVPDGHPDIAIDLLPGSKCNIAFKYEPKPKKTKASKP